MKLKSFVYNIISIFFITTMVLVSQGGSNYSIIGIGDLNYGGNASYTALGGTQIAFPSSYSINSRNPAMWSYAANTRIQVGYNFNQNIVSSEKSTVWHNNGALSGFAGIFAIDSANGIAASFGIVPYSGINYLTATTTELSQIGLDLKGTTTYQGKGGISQAYAGTSAKITDWLGVGLSVFSTFGVVESIRETEFSSDYYSFNYTTTRSDYVSGWGAKTGMFVTPIENMIVGLSYEMQPSLTVSSETNYNSPTIPDTTITSDSDISIPGLFGLGASYSSGNFIFGGDFSVHDFTNFKYNAGANTEYTNGVIASVGVNRIGNPSLNAPFADRVSYKFGLGYHQLHYKVMNNNIIEYTAAMGMQMPFAGSLVADVSFVLGYRNSGDSRLVSEYFGRLGVDISIGETWFVPFKREY